MAASIPRRAGPGYHGSIERLLLPINVVLIVVGALIADRSEVVACFVLASAIAVAAVALLYQSAA